MQQQQEKQYFSVRKQSEAIPYEGHEETDAMSH